ncbi:DUF6518 family protein [Kineosporia babensis]|uniref:DUF6518 family protein n=1 Tax=Kineosporia babensis TaxID=499548 RepID=A0A9X1NLS9_9ACTN|nr:DUF6518 family protein [Kineosporia babensis]MCD5316066.1 DUF6518 family protein [Kineosporia babensis]
MPYSNTDDTRSDNGGGSNSTTKVDGFSLRGLADRGRSLRGLARRGLSSRGLDGRGLGEQGRKVRGLIDRGLSGLGGSGRDSGSGGWGGSSGQAGSGNQAGSGSWAGSSGLGGPGSQVGGGGHGYGPAGNSGGGPGYVADTQQYGGGFTSDHEFNGGGDAGWSGAGSSDGTANLDSSGNRIYSFNNGQGFRDRAFGPRPDPRNTNSTGGSPSEGDFSRAHDSHPVINVDDPSTDKAALTGVALLTFVIGGLTAWAQGFLPEAIHSFANSSSGWTAITVLLIWAVRARPVLAAMLGAVSFVLLTLGYTVMSLLRGAPYDPTLLSVVGLILGPIVGVATTWLREHGLQLALATAVLAGIGVGEGLYGFTVLSQTSPVYWTLTCLAGLALLGGMVARRIKGSNNITLAVGLTAVMAVAFVFSYQALAAMPLFA